MRWMGILSSERATVVGGNLLDTLCAQLEKLMSFNPGERDLVMLQHKFVVEWSDQRMVRPWFSHPAIHRLVD
jgi:saccharopine dehydrogenase (NADP+, L-glutamate forming)